MISLLIDTHTNYLNIAVLRDETVLSYISRQEIEHSTKALEAIDQCCRVAEFRIEDIDRIYVINGPGSFTGIRIGVTIAKTLAYTLKKEIIPVSSLMCYALSNKQNDYVISIIDARRGYIYASIVDKNNNIILEEQYISINNLLEKIKELKGSVIYKSYDTFPNINTEYPVYNFEEIIRYYQDKECVNPHHVNPHYLKKTEAEENLQI